MEEALRNLDEQLDQINPIENEHYNDLSHLSQEEKALLLPFVVEVARCYIEEERAQHKLEKGLPWTRVALSLGRTDESRGFLLQAKLLEAIAIDKLDNFRPERLGLAISRLREVARGAVRIELGTVEYNDIDALEDNDPIEVTAGILAISKARNRLQYNEDVGSLAEYSLRARYERKLLKYSHNAEQADTLKGGLPISQVKGVGLQGLDLTGDDKTVTVATALERLRGGDGKGMDTPKARRRNQKGGI